MSEISTKTQTELDRLLSRLAAGDPAAREALLERSLRRLRELARRELRRFPRLGRWEETDDVLQGAAGRLLRALREVNPPTARDFFNLSTACIRRELIDLHRHHFGPLGQAARHATPRPQRNGDASNGASRLDEAGADEAADPARLAQRRELHERVARLAPEHSELLGLIWYQDLTYEQAAAVLGISVRTVGRRWCRTRIALHELLNDRG